jgi:hypothetical protein
MMRATLESMCKMKRFKRDTPITLTLTLKAGDWAYAHHFIALLHMHSASFLTKEMNDAVMQLGYEMEMALEEAEFMLQPRKSRGIN